MRKLNVFTLLVFVAIFTFISCQKDQMEGIDTPTTMTDLNTEVPTSLAEKVTGNISTFTKELTDKLIEDQPEVIFNEEAATSRNGEDEIKILGPTQPKIKIDCGTYLFSSNDHYHNSFNNAFYARRGYSANLNGGDNVFYIDATNDMLTTFSLSTTPGNRQNLAMFLFEGDYDDHNHFAYVRQVIAASSSSSRFREELTNVSLRRGRRYILVVDSAPDRGADYELRVTCLGNPINNCDDFERYYHGNISPQSANWEKWDYNSRDGIVRGNSNQYLYMARDPYAGQSSQQDVIYKTGRVRSGRKTLSMNLWIYSGYSGYFNIQKRLRQEYGAEIYFHDNGRGELRIANRAYNFSYPQNRWMDIELDYDFYTDRVTFIIDGSVIRSWPTYYSATRTNGSNQIEGIDFYVPKSDAEFFVDNICFQ